MKLSRARGMRGHIKLAGDKSISHRAALMAAAATGVTVIDNFAASADCHSTLACLRQLGVQIEVTDEGCVRVENPLMPNGNLKTHDLAAQQDDFPVLFRPSPQALDCGNSGTTMRLLAGFLAWHNFDSTLTGDASLSRRPMRRIIAPLELMGGRITAVDNHAPLVITGRAPLTAIDYELPVASAQVKSAVLFAGLGAHGTTSVIEKIPTRDHTERMLRWFGVDVATTDDERGTKISVRGGVRLKARECLVPGDVSSAAFIVAAAILTAHSDITLENVLLNPTRTAFLDVLKSFGANIETTVTHQACGEPVGTITARTSPRLSSNNTVIRGATIANLIDEVPMLAVIATQTDTGLSIREARELRVKETDRIAAIVKNLRLMGAQVEEHDDGLTVQGKTPLNGARLDSFDDHRIAMAFSVAGLIAAGTTEIINSECTAVSFPAFYQELKRLTIE